MAPKAQQSKEMPAQAGRRQSLPVGIKCDMSFSRSFRAASRNSRARRSSSANAASATSKLPSASPTHAGETTPDSAVWALVCWTKPSPALLCGPPIAAGAAASARKAGPKRSERMTPARRCPPQEPPKVKSPLDNKSFASSDLDLLALVAFAPVTAMAQGIVAGCGDDGISHPSCGELASVAAGKADGDLGELSEPIAPRCPA
mmetsp:Transcript_32376/g.64212  ORF Transcript_32376/g.64212 Transcript_32376/m.64212 type:complete len:203 (-) Transcript_32376:200-808(-)